MAIIQAFSSSIWKKKFLDVASSATGVIDEIPLTSFRQVAGYFSAYNTTSNVHQSHEFKISYDGSNIKDYVYNKSSPIAGLQFNVVISGPNAQIQIVNNSAYALKLELVKLTVGQE